MVGGLCISLRCPPNCQLQNKLDLDEVQALQQHQAALEARAELDTSIIGAMPKSTPPTCRCVLAHSLFSSTIVQPWCSVKRCSHSGFCRDTDLTAAWRPPTRSSVTDAGS